MMIQNKALSHDLRTDVLPGSENLFGKFGSEWLFMFGFAFLWSLYRYCCVQVVVDPGGQSFVDMPGNRGGGPKALR